jgi:hypothetical protein
MKCGELKQFQEKCETVFRPELRHLKKQFQEKCETVFRSELRHLKKQFQEKCETVFRPELRHPKEQFQEKCETVLRPELRHPKEQFQEKCGTVLRPESIEILHLRSLPLRARPVRWERRRKYDPCHSEHEPMCSYGIIALSLALVGGWG